MGGGSGPFVVQPLPEDPGAVRENHSELSGASSSGECDPEGEPVLDVDGQWVPDPDLTDYENVPLTESVKDYVAREVLPHFPDA